MLFDWGNGVSVVKEEKGGALGDYEGVLLRIKVISFIIGGASGEFFEIFGLGLARILPELLFKGLVLLHFSKLLFFYKYSFTIFIILANFHLVINFLHKHNFWLSFFTRLFKLVILSLGSGLSLDVYSPPSLPAHANITLYPQSSNNISNSQHHTSITSTSSSQKNTSHANTPAVLGLAWDSCRWREVVS